MKPDLPYFPMEPFERKMRREGVTDTEFAETIGITRDALNHWRKRGINFYSADKLAIRMGYHPSYFWPEYWDATDITPTADTLTH